MLGYILTIVIVGGAAGAAVHFASQNVDEPRVALGITFVAGSLAGLIARRPGAALLAQALALILPMVLEGVSLEYQFDAYKFQLISMAVGAELAFLLTGYRYFNLFTAVGSSLLTAVGYMVGLEWAYGQFELSEEVARAFAELLAVPALAAGVAAFVIAFVIAKVLRRR